MLHTARVRRVGGHHLDERRRMTLTTLFGRPLSESFLRARAILLFVSYLLQQQILQQETGALSNLTLIKSEAVRMCPRRSDSSIERATAAVRDMAEEGSQQTRSLTALPRALIVQFQGLRSATSSRGSQF